MHGGEDDAYRLAGALIELGELRAAVDLMRQEVSGARAAVPIDHAMLVRLLSQYAEILEMTRAFGEAMFVRAEVVEVVASARLPAAVVVDAYLKYGLLLCKLHNYHAAIANLREAVRRCEELDEIGALRCQIVLAQAWRGQAQALEAIGLFAEATSALDQLTEIKGQIRFMLFSPSRGRRRPWEEHHGT